MILRRLARNLKEQNWTAIGIDFAIVVLGVFVGIQVANWNAARLQAREGAMLRQMRVEPADGALD